MLVAVPFLKEKIKSLIDSPRRPDIVNQQQLADVLDITNSYLDKILNNRTSEVNPPHVIPEDSMDKLIHEYFLSKECFMLDSLADFKKKIISSDAVLNDLLLNAAQDENAFYLAAKRGIRPSSSVQSSVGNKYILGQEFKINLYLTLGWSTLLLCKDPNGWISLGNPFSCRKGNDQQKKANESIEGYFDYPLGQHYFMVIMLNEHLPVGFLESLNGNDQYQREKSIFHLGYILQNLSLNHKLIYQVPFFLQSNI